jgi:DNA-binding transcriptional MerR regulator
MHHRIGEFASLTGLSVKTLRFYAEIGLLTPAAVGFKTGYRLYSMAQVERARYILSLRQFGLTLAQIKDILAAGVSERIALEAARDRLSSSVSEGQKLLRSIETRLAQLPSSAIRLCRLPLMRVASVVKRVAAPTEAENILAELEECLRPAAEEARGILWHRCADAGFFEAEPFIETSESRVGRGSIRVTDLPAVTAACAPSADDVELAEATYRSLREWLPQQGYELSAAKREIVRWQGGIRTLEIQFPVRPRRGALQDR